MNLGRRTCLEHFAVLIIIAFRMLVSPFELFAQERAPFARGYFFINSSDREFTKIMVKNDSLYEWHGTAIVNGKYLSLETEDHPESTYKVLSTSTSQDVHLLRLESLDSVPLSSDPVPDTRFSVLVIRGITEDMVAYLPLQSGLTMKEVKAYATNSDEWEGKFFFTYYSENSWRRFAKLKRIASKKDAHRIVQYLNGAEAKALVASYLESKIPDLYGSGLMSELITRGCIKLGYNPLLATKELQRFSAVSTK